MRHTPTPQDVSNVPSLPNQHIPIVPRRNPNGEPPPAPSKLLVNYREGRHMMGDVPESTWALWIQQGILKPVRIGPRRAFVRVSDLEALAQGGLPKAG